MNGQFVGESHDWQAQPIFDIKKFIHAGDNVIAVGVNNGVGQGGLNPNVTVKIIGHASVPPWSRSLFNGLAQIIVQSTRDAGEFKLTASRRWPDAGDGGGANATLRAASVRAVKLKTASLSAGWCCPRFLPRATTIRFAGGRRCEFCALDQPFATLQRVQPAGRGKHANIFLRDGTINRTVNNVGCR